MPFIADNAVTVLLVLKAMRLQIFRPELYLWHLESCSQLVHLHCHYLYKYTYQLMS